MPAYVGDLKVKLVFVNDFQQVKLKEHFKL